VRVDFGRFMGEEGDMSGWQACFQRKIKGVVRSTVGRWILGVKLERGNSVVFWEVRCF